jgi:hypothetical protein
LLPCVSGIKTEPSSAFCQFSVCQHSGTARNRARQSARVTSGAPRLQQLTLNFRWHAACGISSCAMEKDSPMETVSPLRTTNKGRHDGCFWCSRILLLIVLLIVVVPTGGCLYRTRPVTLHASTAQLQTATGSDLIERINAKATEIQTLNATVGITASVGGSKLGKITEYQEICSYILARKPSSLRMIGLFPILQNHLFDMVSSGQEFKLWIPPKNQSIVGDDDGARPSAEPPGDLGPQVIYDALLLQAVDRQNELAVLEGGEHEVIDPGGKLALQPDYTLHIIKQNGRGWYLSRKVVFDRTDLQPRQQLFYDEHGSIVTDVHYDEYREFNGVFFPTNIQIWRSQEECSIKLEVTKLTVVMPGVSR